jgi:hypothetical protein
VPDRRLDEGAEPLACRQADRRHPRPTGPELLERRGRAHLGCRGHLLHGRSPWAHWTRSIPRTRRIGSKRAERIQQGWAEQKVIREIMLLLHRHGVGASRAVWIFKIYDADAVQVICENLYRLARDIIHFPLPTS